jgi:integrase
VRPKRTFREAATRYLQRADKATIRDDAGHLKMLDRFIGDVSLERVHMGSLQGFIDWRKAQGRKNRTINYALQTVRHILNLCTGEWMDENGITWIAHAPKIKLLREDDKRGPYPLDWEEQFRLFSELPDYLRKMALFKVNTGCREAEVCSLRWEWERKVEPLNSSVFIIPGAKVKNRQDRLVVLNRLAKAVIEQVRGMHPEYVFSYRGKPVSNMNNRAWKEGRARAGLSEVRVHDLKHTFGRRLRAAGVSFEDRQDLLGHKSTGITTHYSMPELENLIAAANAVCPEERHKIDTMVVLRRNLRVVAAT